MREWAIVKIAVFLSVFVFALIFFTLGFSEEPLRINIRLSARVSAILFSLAFMASAVQYFYKGEFSFWLLVNRKFLGISFAIIHLIHLAFLGTLHYCYHPIFTAAATESILSGSLAYLFLVIMLFTSFDRFSKFMSHKIWKVTHTIGGYWIWLIFMISYAKRVDTEIEYLPMIILFLGTLILRLGKQYSLLRKRS